MSNRDWEKELAMIDRQLAELSDEKLLAANQPAPAAAAPAAGAPAPPARGAAKAPPAPRQAPTTTTISVGPVPPGRRWMLYVRLLAALGLSAGVVAWPFGWRCGEELFLYLGLVGATLLAGLWSAVWSWRHRAGKSHVLSLAVVLLALGAAAWQVGPRVGAMLPTMDRPGVWACE